MDKVCVAICNLFSNGIVIEYNNRSVFKTWSFLLRKMNYLKKKKMNCCAKETSKPQCNQNIEHDVHIVWLYWDSCVSSQINISNGILFSLTLLLLERIVCIEQKRKKTHCGSFKFIVAGNRWAYYVALLLK